MDAAAWADMLTDTGVGLKSAEEYVKKFAQEKLTMSNIEMLDRSMPPELGVTVICDEFTSISHETRRQGGETRDER